MNTYIEQLADWFQNSGLECISGADVAKIARKWRPDLIRHCARCQYPLYDNNVCPDCGYKNESEEKGRES